MTAAAGPGAPVIPGVPVVWLETTRSTNSEAWILADQGAIHGTTVVADAQTAGRGRLGRSWYSPPGSNLYFSLVVRPDLAPERAATLSLAAGSAVAGVLDLRVKWPNDVVSDQGAKVAGLLAEMDVRNGRVRHVILGVGVNVNQPSFPEDLPQATSLALLRGCFFDRTVLLARLVPAILAEVDRAVSDPAAMLAGWRARSHTLGRRVRIDVGVPGSPTSASGQVEGRAEDLRDDGALLVRDDTGGLRPVLTGDVSVVEPPPAASLPPGPADRIP